MHLNFLKRESMLKIMPKRVAENSKFDIINKNLHKNKDLTSYSAKVQAVLHQLKNPILVNNIYYYMVEDNSDIHASPNFFIGEFGCGSSAHTALLLVFYLSRNIHFTIALHIRLKITMLCDFFWAANRPACPRIFLQQYIMGTLEEY